MNTIRETLAARPAAAGQAALRHWTLARVVALRWAAWDVAALIAAVFLAVVARQWSQAQQGRLNATSLAADTASPARVETSSDHELLARLPAGYTKAIALQTLDIALSTTPSVQLVATEFSTQPGSADRLDRTDIAFRLRGPYTDVKRVLSIWSARFVAGSVLSLRVQPQPSTPGVVEANVNGALWSRPSTSPQSPPTAESPR
jgi:hypothetical protein